MQGTPTHPGEILPGTHPTTLKLSILSPCFQAELLPKQALPSTPEPRGLYPEDTKQLYFVPWI